MASVLSSLALQIKFCAFKVFQGERNEVITKYAVYLAIYFKLLESISIYWNNYLSRLLLWLNVFFHCHIVYFLNRICFILPKYAANIAKHIFSLLFLVYFFYCQIYIHLPMNKEFISTSGLPSQVPSRYLSVFWYNCQIFPSPSWTRLPAAVPPSVRRAWTSSWNALWYWNGFPFR